MSIIYRLAQNAMQPKVINFKAEQIPDLTGKIAIVTGASSGLGLISTLLLAKNKAQVIMACRNVTKAKEALEKLKQDHPEVNFDKVSILELDLASLASVRKFVQEFVELKLPLHILMNNAGIMAPPEFSLSKDGIESQLASNHFGHFYLTLLLLPVLEKTATSTTSGNSVRIVNLSSSAHRRAKEIGIDFEGYNDPAQYEAWHGYGQSKLANILFTKELQKRLDARGVKNIITNAVHPGVVNTSLAHTSQSKGIPLWLTPYVGWMLLETPEFGALTQMYAATSPDVDEKKIKAEYLVPTAVIEDPTTQAKDAEMAAKLWEFSERIIKEKGFSLSL